MIILVDQDNTLADFDGAFLNLWREKYPQRFFVPTDQRRNFYVKDDYPTELHRDMEEIYTTPGFIRNLPVIPGAQAAIKEMLELGNDVLICTSPLSKYENNVLEKFEWVEINFGRELTKQIIIAGDKTLIRGSILIDDKPKVSGIMNPLWEHILFDRPYNREVPDKKRLDWSNWKQVLKFTEEA